MYLTGDNGEVRFGWGEEVERPGGRSRLGTMETEGRTGDVETLLAINLGEWDGEGGIVVLPSVPGQKSEERLSYTEIR